MMSPMSESRETTLKASQVAWSAATKRDAFHGEVLAHRRRHDHERGQRIGCVGCHACA